MNIFIFVFTITTLMISCADVFYMEEESIEEESIEEESIVGYWFFANLDTQNLNV